MLDQLMKLVEEHAGDAIINNPAIPNQHNNAAIKDVASQIFGGLQSQASGGNLQQIVSMFQNGGGSSIAHNPMVANIISSVAGNFASKLACKARHPVETCNRSCRCFKTEAAAPSLTTQW